MSNNKICELFDKSGLLIISHQQMKLKKKIDNCILIDDDLAKRYLNLKHLYYEESNKTMIIDYNPKLVDILGYND